MVICSQADAGKDILNSYYHKLILVLADFVVAPDWQYGFLVGKLYRAG